MGAGLQPVYHDSGHRPVRSCGLVFIVLAYQTGKIMSGQVHRDAIVALQKAKAESETLWKERYDDIRNDRDRYRDIALMNSQVAVRGVALATDRVAKRSA
jgi:hypothetical protein